MTKKNAKPSTHYIDATEAQVNWLNRIADINQKYRTHLHWLKGWTEKALNGSTQDIDHQTFSKVQTLNGALAELLALRHVIFPPFPEEGKERAEQAARVSGWVQLALTENPDGLLNINWFIVKKGE